MKPALKKLKRISEQFTALLGDLPRVVPVADPEATWYFDVFVPDCDLAEEPVDMIVGMVAFELRLRLHFAQLRKTIRPAQHGEAILKTWTGFERDRNWPQYKGQFLFRQV